MCAETVFHIPLLKVDGFFSQCSVFRPVSVFAKITFGSNDIPRSSWEMIPQAWHTITSKVVLFFLTESYKLNQAEWEARMQSLFFFFHTSSEMLYWLEVQDFNGLVSCVCFWFLC